jgi:3-hydroxyacyl-[acyl-carrier protein] dehydratase/trans-2-decenoyl-[acyl-carrier protein] isomerase
MLGTQIEFRHAGLAGLRAGRIVRRGQCALPLPPMLMFDRITRISEKGGSHDKGEIEAEMEVRPDLWFFKCHFQNDPVMPGCLGVDAMWQMVGLFPRLAGRARQGPRARRRRSEVLRHGAAQRQARQLLHRIQARDHAPLVVGIADGIMKVDGKVIYEAKDLRVGLFTDRRRASARLRRRRPERTRR